MVIFFLFYSRVTAEPELMKAKISQAHKYLAQVKDFTTWCQLNYLDLNVKKTKGMIIDFRVNKDIPDNIVINSEPVGRVTQYK